MLWTIQEFFLCLKYNLRGILESKPHSPTRNFLFASPRTNTGNVNICLLFICPLMNVVFSRWVTKKPIFREFCLSCLFIYPRIYRGVWHITGPHYL